MNNQDWRPIEEAPSDCALLLGWWRYEPDKQWVTRIGYAWVKQVGYCPAIRDRVSSYQGHKDATHFQYLPTAPEAA